MHWSGQTCTSQKVRNIAAPAGRVSSINDPSSELLATPGMPALISFTQGPMSPVERPAVQAPTSAVPQRQSLTLIAAQFVRRAQARTALQAAAPLASKLEQGAIGGHSASHVLQAVLVA